MKPGSLRIELNVLAEHPDQAIDRIQFQNRVRQHLEEDEDVSFSEHWGLTFVAKARFTRRSAAKPPAT